MQSPSDMSGKAAIVTGAAAGLGRATAIRLAQAGADVSIVDLNADGLAATAAEIAALGRAADVQRIDLSDPAQCRLVVPAAIAALGRLDALCNVAGVFLPSHTPDMAQADAALTIAVNLTAPFLLIQQAIPHLLEAHGAVVNVSSCAALVGQAYCAVYCATKAGLTHMTKALAIEYAKQPIRFNTVAPGGMMTQLAMGLMALPDPDPALLRFAPIRGVVEIEDVAEMVAFLATPAARGYHGACISIDNGITAG